MPLPLLSIDVRPGYSLSIADGSLAQVARKSAFCAFCVATCRSFQPKWTVFGGEVATQNAPVADLLETCLQ